MTPHITKNLFNLGWNELLNNYSLVDVWNILIYFRQPKKKENRDDDTKKEKQTKEK